MYNHHVLNLIFRLDLKSILELYPREDNKNKAVAVLTSGGDSQGIKLGEQTLYTGYCFIFIPGPFVRLD